MMPHSFIYIHISDMHASVCAASTVLYGSRDLLVHSRQGFSLLLILLLLCFDSASYTSALKLHSLSTIDPIPRLKNRKQSLPSVEYRLLFFASTRGRPSALLTAYFCVDPVFAIYPALRREEEEEEEGKTTFGFEFAGPSEYNSSFIRSGSFQPGFHLKRSDSLRPTAKVFFTLRSCVGVCNSFVIIRPCAKGRTLAVAATECIREDATSNDWQYIASESFSIDGASEADGRRKVSFLSSPSPAQL